MISILASITVGVSLLASLLMVLEALTLWKARRVRATKQITSNKGINRSADTPKRVRRPPLNAEFILYLFLQKTEQDEVIGDLREGYNVVCREFGKLRGDIWYYWQVTGSLFPLLRRALLKIAALVWLGRVLRRLIS